MAVITMAELDRLFRLKRGTANALRRKGVFEAEQVMGRLWAVEQQDLSQVGAAILAFMSNPGDEDEPTVSVLAASMRLKLAQSTIYNLIRLGKLKTVPVPRGRIFVTAAVPATPVP